MDASSVPVGDPLEQLPSFGVALLRMVLALGVVLALGIGAIWLLRRRGGLAKAQGKGALNIVESRTLTYGHAVHLLRVGDQFVLVSSSPGGVRALSEVLLDNDALLEQHPAPGHSGFASSLKTSKGDAEPTGGP